MSTQNTPKELTQSRLKELLHYDPETGIFTWRVTRGSAHAGDIAGAAHIAGYVSLCVDCKPYLAHRLVFIYMTGVWPKDQVDHINGVRTDNRWCNLREASNQENGHNHGSPPRHNTSGFIGASWHKQRGYWRASIRLNGINIHLGIFATPELAHAAYLKGKNELHPTHQRLRSAA